MSVPRVTHLFVSGSTLPTLMLCAQDMVPAYLPTIVVVLLDTQTTNARFLFASTNYRLTQVYVAPRALVLHQIVVIASLVILVLTVKYLFALTYLET